MTFLAKLWVLSCKIVFACLFVFLIFAKNVESIIAIFPVLKSLLIGNKEVKMLTNHGDIRQVNK